MAHRSTRRLTALVAAVTAACWMPSVAYADTVAFTISDERIVESSGLARDVEQNLYWTVNDSGEGGVAYALTPKGAVAGTLNYRATPVDVEAVAMYGRRLYLADIGDNDKARNFVTVYAFDGARADDRTVEYKAYDFVYPDGPHDAETLLVDGVGRLYIVTKDKAGKGTKGAGIYAAPGVPSRTALNQLTRVGPAPAYVTDGTFLPGDQRVALRTYLSVEILNAIDYSLVASAATPAQPQGESITVNLAGNRLLVGSEGTGSTVYAMPVPTKKSDVPDGTGTPPAETDPSPSAEPDVEEDPASTAPATRSRGTLLAVGLAAVLAVTAGAVTGVVRRR